MHIYHDTKSAANLQKKNDICKIFRRKIEKSPDLSDFSFPLLVVPSAYMPIPLRSLLDASELSLFHANIEPLSSHYRAVFESERTFIDTVRLFHLLSGEGIGFILAEDIDITVADEFLCGISRVGIYRRSCGCLTIIFIDGFDIDTIQQI